MWILLKHTRHTILPRRPRMTPATPLVWAQPPWATRPAPWLSHAGSCRGRRGHLPVHDPLCVVLGALERVAG